MITKQPEGVRYYKLFHCYGCQTCYAMQPDGTTIQYPHVYYQKDITDEVNAMREKLGLQKEES